MATIPLPALSIKPPAQQENVVDQYTRLKQLQQMQAMQPLQQQEAQQQVQSGALDVQQKQQQLQDQKAVTAAMQQWDGKDLNELPPLVLKNGGSGQAVMGLKQKQLEMQTSMSTIAKNQGEAGVSQITALKGKGDLISGALSPLVDPQQTPDAQLVPKLQQTVQGLVQQGVLDPQHAQAAQQLMQNPDPNAIRTGVDAFRKTFMAQSQIADEALKTAQTQEAKATTAKTQMETASGGTGAMADSRYRNILMAQKLGQPVSPEDNAFLSAYRQQKTLVPAFNFNLQSGAGAGNAPLNQNQQATATAILEGRMTPPSSFALKTPYWQNVMGAVFQQDPQFSEQRAQLRKDYTTGKHSTEINSINTAMGHVGVLNDAIDALQNNNVQILNRIANSLGAQVGSDKMTTFNTIVHRVGPEIAKAYIGAGGSAGERGSDEKDFDPALGPQQLKSNVAITAKLMRSKVAGLENQWDQNKSANMPSFQDRFIMPEAKQVLDRLAPASGGTGVNVIAPNGKSYSFKDQASADAFKQKAGIQ